MARLAVRGALALALLGFGFVAGCRGSTEPRGNTPPVLESLPRSLTTAEAQVSSAANGFSFALFREVSKAEPHRNVFISPLSASFSLGMTLNGARGGTFDAMRTALQHGSASQGDINAGYRGLLDLLGELDPAVALTIANSIWYRNNFAVSTAFKSTAEQYFDATVQGLSFADVTGSLATVNGWVNDKTAGKIQTILDDIRDEDVMFLINAIHFKGSWRSRFDASKTASAPFMSSTGATQQARMMFLDDSVSVGSANGATVLDLPYGNRAFSMTVVLPPTGTSLDAFAGTLTAGQWNGLVASLHVAKVPVRMPKLSFEYERTLNNDLTALGMGLAFTDLADFTGLQATPTGGLLLTFVKQKAFVDINEEGTEAAAVTVTGVGLTSAPMPVNVDRPYLFVIRERLTGTILFMGKVNRVE
jgi:serine protease inhibitor